MQRYELLFRLTNLTAIKNLKLRNVAWVLLLLHINGNTSCEYVATLLIRYAIIYLFFCNIFHFYCLIHIY